MGHRKRGKENLKGKKERRKEEDKEDVCGCVCRERERRGVCVPGGTPFLGVDVFAIKEKEKEKKRKKESERERKNGKYQYFLKKEKMFFEFFCCLLFVVNSFSLFLSPFLSFSLLFSLSLSFSLSRCLSSSSVTQRSSPSSSTSSSTPASPRLRAPST